MKDRIAERLNHLARHTFVRLNLERRPQARGDRFAQAPVRPYHLEQPVMPERTRSLQAHACNVVPQANTGERLHRGGRPEMDNRGAQRPHHAARRAFARLGNKSRSQAQHERIAHRFAHSEHLKSIPLPEFHHNVSAITSTAIFRVECSEHPVHTVRPQIAHRNAQRSSDAALRALARLRPRRLAQAGDNRLPQDPALQELLADVLIVRSFAPPDSVAGVNFDQGQPNADRTESDHRSTQCPNQCIHHALVCFCCESLAQAGDDCSAQSPMLLE
mmetsp:Transcript_33876/g.97435  ORF Transcript_33876/g.97435 Transcript_33876/m.97435 type:complete len:274 (+) Transcript_33876:719-1540(+)